MSFSTSQLVQLAVWPKITALASFIGSLCIVIEVIRDPKKRDKPYQQILCAMGFTDVIGSLAIGLSTWPIPKGTAMFAVGNRGTCISQAFFAQCFGLLSPCLNVSLAIYYLLVVRYGWSDRKIRERAMKYLFLAPILFTLTLAFTSLGLGIYGNAFLWCWIGFQHPWFQLFFFYVPIWSCMIVSLVALILTYCAVRKQENRAKKWTKGSIRTRDERKLSRPLAIQATLYFLAFLISWCPGTILRLRQLFGAASSIYPNLLATAIFTPTQGIFNFLIYIHRRLIRVLKESDLKENFSCLKLWKLICCRVLTCGVNSSKESHLDSELNPNRSSMLQSLSRSFTTMGSTILKKWKPKASPIKKNNNIEISIIFPKKDVDVGSIHDKDLLEFPKPVPVAMLSESERNPRRSANEEEKEEFSPLYDDMEKQDASS